MTVKAAAQQTLIDMTDAYSVFLTSEAYTFPGTTSGAVNGSSCTTSVLVYRGDTQMDCSVTAASIVKPTSITVSVDNTTNTKEPKLTITTTSALTGSADIELPVVVTGAGITITKKFSVSVAKTGNTGASGANGANGANGTNGTNGADALTVVITSSNGFIFKNTSINTNLIASVYKGGVLLTDANLTSLGYTIKWYKDGGATAVQTGSSLTISAGAVSGKANYVAQLEG